MLYSVIPAREGMTPFDCGNYEHVTLACPESDMRK